MWLPMSSEYFYCGVSVTDVFGMVVRALLGGCLLTGQSQKVSTLKSLWPCTHSEVVQVTCLNAHR